MVNHDVKRDTIMSYNLAFKGSLRSNSSLSCIKMSLTFFHKKKKKKKSLGLGTCILSIQLKNILFGLINHNFRLYRCWELGLRNLPTTASIILPAHLKIADANQMLNFKFTSNVKKGIKRNLLVLELRELI